MRILVVSHSYIVDLNCEKLRSLAKLDPAIEVTIVVPKRWRPGGVMKNVVVARAWQDGNFRVVPVLNFSQNNQGLLCFGPELIQLLRQFRPDVIQVEQGVKSLAYAQLILLDRLLNLRAKRLFFTWWNLPYQLKFPVSLIEKFNLANTDGIVVGNQAGYEIFKQKGYDRAMQVMPQLGIDDRIFQPQRQPELRSQLGIAPTDFVIGFVGRFVPEKGLMTLLQAAAGLGQRPWKLLLLGRGPLQEELLATATELGIRDRLILVESVPHAEVYRYINSMDTLVLPSETTYQFKTLTAMGWQEQFGHVLIEAMGCQVPVIGSDSGEIPNVIADAGLVFPEGDRDALRDRLMQLIDRPEFAQEMGQRGYQRAIVKYTNQALAKELLAFYQTVVRS
ncbi:hormogonium polysaccharide biosynthesis glycosyltransferase HpsO [Alkalinema pantanalense CENA528]|uniref:hormogonium polysaccharide biosynthesis glycosyltransferase HpsO n=1 Tax=Alkalinema pantanalense TaxID=1620705 RepID=UPI003D6FAE0E